MYLGVDMRYESCNEYFFAVLRIRAALVADHFVLPPPGAAGGVIYFRDTQHFFWLILS